MIAFSQKTLNFFLNPFKYLSTMLLVTEQKLIEGSQQTQLSMWQKETLSKYLTLFQSRFTSSFVRCQEIQISLLECDVFMMESVQKKQKYHCDFWMVSNSFLNNGYSSILNLCSLNSWISCRESSCKLLEQCFSSFLML